MLPPSRWVIPLLPIGIEMCFSYRKSKKVQVKGIAEEDLRLEGAGCFIEVKFTERETNLMARECANM